MGNYSTALIACAASVLMIFVSYFVGRRVLESETAFSEWERRNNCRIIHKEYRLFWRKNWHRVLVEDSTGNLQGAWVRFGFFSDNDETIWD